MIFLRELKPVLQSEVLTEIEIELWENGHEFKDPWPKNIVKMVN
jgi:hypothetical protein